MYKEKLMIMLLVLTYHNSVISGEVEEKAGQAEEKERVVEAVGQAQEAQNEFLIEPVPMLARDASKVVAQEGNHEPHFGARTAGESLSAKTISTVSATIGNLGSKLGIPGSERLQQGTSILKGPHQIANMTKGIIYIGIYLQNKLVHYWLAENTTPEEAIKLPKELHVLSKNKIITLSPYQAIQLRLPYIKGKLNSYATLVFSQDKKQLKEGLAETISQNNIISLGGDAQSFISENVNIVTLGENSLYALAGEDAKIFSRMAYLIKSERTLKGQTFLQDIITASAFVQADSTNMSSIMWFLLLTAFNKDQLFTEGTFVIEDDNGNLFDWIKSNPGSKERISTHFKEYHIVQYGLNLTQLPFNFTTILFGQFVHAGNHRKYLFLKPESHGVEGVVETVQHGASFVAAQGRKLIPGADDMPEWRKERVPDELVSRFRAITEKIAQIGKTWGIWEMHDMVNNEFTQIANKLPESEKQSFSDLIQNFNAGCGKYDNLTIRKGREVIIVKQDIAEQ